MDLQIGGQKRAETLSARRAMENLNNTSYAGSPERAVYRGNLRCDQKIGAQPYTGHLRCRIAQLLREVQESSRPILPLGPGNIERSYIHLTTSSVLGETITKAGNGSQGIIGDAYRKLTGRLHFAACKTQHCSR